MDKKGLLLYLDTIPQWKMMSDAQAGSLIKALLDYAESGKPLESDDIVVKMAFAFISAQVDRADESYQKVCERNKKAAENRWKNKAESLPGKEKADSAESETVPDESEVCEEIPENTTEYQTVPENTTECQTVPENTKKCLPNPNPNPNPKPNPNNISFFVAHSATETKKFTAPDVQTVETYIRENRLNVDARSFVDYYDARDWVLSHGIKMTDWQAQVRYWHNNHNSGAYPRIEKQKCRGDSGTCVADGTASFDIADFDALANNF